MTSRSIPANAIALITARVFTAGAATLVAAIAARQLGEGGFGTYVAVATAGFLANTVATFGTDTLVVGSVSRGEDSADVGRSIGLQLAIVAVFIGAATIAVIVIGDKALPLLIQAGGLVAGVWATAAGSVLRGRERMDLAAISTTTGAFVAVAGAIVAGSADGSVEAFVLAIVVGQVAAASCAVLLATDLKAANGRFKIWVPSFDRSFVAAARPYATMVGASAAAASVGVLSLELFGNDIDTGHFAAASRIAEGLQLLPAAAFGAAFPAMARNVHLGDRYARGVRSLLIVTAAITALTLLSADLLIDLVFDDFEEAADVLRILALGLMPLLLRTRWSFELISDGAQNSVAHLAVAAALVTVVLSVLSATLWGPRSVAASVTIGVTFHAISLWNLRRRTEVITHG